MEWKSWGPQGIPGTLAKNALYVEISHLSRSTAPVWARISELYDFQKVSPTRFPLPRKGVVRSHDCEEGSNLPSRERRSLVLP